MQQVGAMSSVPGGVAVAHSREPTGSLGQPPAELKLCCTHLQAVPRNKGVCQRVLQILMSSLSRDICSHPADVSKAPKSLPHSSKMFIPVGQVEVFPLLGLLQLLQVRAGSKRAWSASPLPAVMPSGATFCCSPPSEAVGGVVGAAEQLCCGVCAARGAGGHLCARATSTALPHLPSLAALEHL